MYRHQSYLTPDFDRTVGRGAWWKLATRMGSQMRGNLITLAAGVLLAACVSSSNSSQSETLGAPQQLAGPTGSPTSNEALRPIKVAESQTAPTTAGYRIGAMDVLDISVFQVPELTKSVQVADTGTINLPLDR